MSTEQWKARETGAGVWEFAAELQRCSNLGEILDKTLTLVTSLLGADLGNVRLLDKRRNILEIAVHSAGYSSEFLDHFKTVGRGDGSVCGRALGRQGCVVIEDVETDPEFAPHRSIAVRSGIRSVQSFPLIGRSGDVLGVASAHFRRPHRPAGEELRATELYLQRAANAIEGYRQNGH